MKLNSPITKVLAATVAAGVVTLSAVGFGGTASADGFQAYVPAMAPVAPQPPVINTFVNPYIRYNQPYLVNGRWVYPYQTYANQYVNPYVNALPYAYQAQYVQAA